jgi:hypothetical protein
LVEEKCTPEVVRQLDELDAIVDAVSTVVSNQRAWREKASENITPLLLAMVALHDASEKRVAKTVSDNIPRCEQLTNIPTTSS